MTVYPNSEDYVRAVQQPATSFRTPALRRAVLDVHPLWGIPVPASGNAAVVFKAAVDGTPQALRFFIREDASSRERYGALGRHFLHHGIMDCVADVTWIDDAIEVGGRTWPMVQMEWVEGRTLDAYVGHLAEHGDVSALQLLAASWRDGVRRLQGAAFAHGDLQHANVLVDTTSALRLVDFDGSWIDAFEGGPPPNETGHPNYQRTGRTWGRWMDTFPAVVIHTSLLALTRRPDAWRTLHNGENMLFSHDDFTPPFRTRAWEFVSRIGDPEMVAAVERLRQCCHPQWSPGGTLEELMGRTRVVAGPPAPPPPAYLPPPDDPTMPWWMRTNAAAPPMPPRVPPPRPAPDAAMPPPPPKQGPQPGTGAQPVFRGPQAGPSWYSPGPGTPPGTPPRGTPPPGRGRPPGLPVKGAPLPAALIVAIALIVILLFLALVAANS